MNTLTPKDKMEHAWRYFALHAAQRISVFNFFLVLFGIAVAGLAGCLRAGGNLLPIGACIGAALVTLAFTFWKLDQRTAFLVKHAESRLTNLETEHLSKSESLFSPEVEHTTENQTLRPHLIRLWSYSTCFRLAFGFAAMVGVVGAVFALCSWVD